MNHKEQEWADLKSKVIKDKERREKRRELGLEPPIYNKPRSHYSGTITQASPTDVHSLYERDLVFSDFLYESGELTQIIYRQKHQASHRHNTYYVPVQDRKTLEAFIIDEHLSPQLIYKTKWVRDHSTNKHRFIEFKLHKFAVVD